MQLQKFNLPRTIVEAISCATPEIQGQVYAALFAYIYNDDCAAGDALDGDARAIYLLAKAVAEPLVIRARRAALRRLEKEASGSTDASVEPEAVTFVIPEPEPESPRTDSPESAPVPALKSSPAAVAAPPRRPALIPKGARRLRADALYQKRHRA